eukprot:scaffold964_cov96-Skeletonema_dohrnii-CCMP3373.AAC.1
MILPLEKYAALRQQHHVTRNSFPSNFNFKLSRSPMLRPFVPHGKRITNTDPGEVCCVVCVFFPVTVAHEGRENIWGAILHRNSPKRACAPV